MVLEDKTDLKGRFEAAFQLMHRKEFLDNRILGGEIPFYLMDYPIGLHTTMEKEIDAFSRRLTTEGISVLLIDIFQISIEVIKENSSIEKMVKLEQRKKFGRFLKAIQSTLDVKERVTPKIIERIEKHSPELILIKGIAHIYPFLRVNEILNHLNTELSHIPTLVFYPGSYVNKQLTLFDRIEDSRYYRAHPINEIKSVRK
ncbi:MAG: DUF1788 domain-containing protein [Saprospirales bacterium]|nr:MAG: DUF1788 domain-containing protein [Saprospirales bacterium]